MRDCRGQIGGIKRGKPGENRRSLARAHDQPRSHLLADAARKAGTGSVIDRNCDYARDSAGQKGSDPLGAVGTPEEDGIAFGDVAGLKFAGKLGGSIAQYGRRTSAPGGIHAERRRRARSPAAIGTEVVVAWVIRYTCPHTLFSSTIPGTSQKVCSRWARIGVEWRDSYKYEWRDRLDFVGRTDLAGSVSGAVGSGRWRGCVASERPDRKPDLQRLIQWTIARPQPGRSCRRTYSPQARLVKQMTNCANGWSGSGTSPALRLIPTGRPPSTRWVQQSLNRRTGFSAG